MATRFAIRITKYRLGFATVFVAMILFFASGSMGDRVAVTKSNNAEDGGIVVNEDFPFFCFFAAYTFGPASENNPYFNSDLTDINNKLKENYSDRFPLNDGRALLFLFDDEQELQHVFTLRERKGYIRWRVSQETAFHEFCASKENVAIQLIEGNDFVLLGFK